MEFSAILRHVTDRTPGFEVRIDDINPASVGAQRAARTDAAGLHDHLSRGERLIDVRVHGELAFEGFATREQVAQLVAAGVAPSPLDREEQEHVAIANVVTTYIALLGEPGETQPPPREWKPGPDTFAYRVGDERRLQIDGVHYRVTRVDTMAYDPFKGTGSAIILEAVRLEFTAN